MPATKAARSSSCPRREAAHECIRLSTSDARRDPVRQVAAALGLAALLAACASPGERLLRKADELGFSRRVLVGGGFRMEGFFSRGGNQSHILHVYLEGDGRPWSESTRVSADPTPRHPLMLGLMRMDRSPSLYLGRPCYNGHAEDPGCSPLLWTHRRYGPEIVEAMADGLRSFLNENPHRGLVFLGHSGGGALALLLAQRFPETRTVVTLAGNADIDVWADLHGYSRLEGSLNPADFPTGQFQEIHYLAENDKTMPPAAFEPVLRKRPRAKIYVLLRIDHDCCWDMLWGDLLAQLASFPVDANQYGKQ